MPAQTPGSYADLSLEQLMNLKVERVYGVSKHEQKVTHAPSSVSIVTADDIRQFGWRTLSDILRSVRGFYTTDDRNYGYVGVRGFLRPGDYNTRVLVLVDGHRTNDNVYDGGYMGREQMLATDLIERVEIIRGPSSSVYGSSAFFGVINVVTKRPAGNGAQLTTEVGDRNTFEGRLTFDHKFREGFEWRISATHFTTEGEDRLYFPEFDPRISSNPAADNNGVAVDSDLERSSHLFSSLRFHDFTVSAFVSRRVKDVPTASYLTVFNHGTERTYDRRGYVDLKFDRALGEHRLLARGFYDQYRYDGRYPYDYGTAAAPDISVDSDGAIGEWIGTELQFNAKLSETHSLALGSEFRRNLREEQFAHYGGVTTLDDRRKSHTLGFFSEWEARLAKSLLLTAGVRHDRYSASFGSTTNPRFGLIYQLSEVATIKVLSGRAFRAPNPYERFYYSSQSSRPTLRPERIKTHEVVFERYWSRVYRSSVSVYHYQVDELVTQRETAAGDLYFENVDTIRANGLEVESEARYESGWLVRGSLAWQKAEDTIANQPLTSSPRGLGKLNLAWAPARKGCSAGLEVQHQTKSRTLAGAETAGFTLINLNLLTTRLLPACEVSLTAWNVLDKRHQVPGAADLAQDALAQARRTLRLKLTRTF